MKIQKVIGGWYLRVFKDILIKELCYKIFEIKIYSPSKSQTCASKESDNTKSDFHPDVFKDEGIMIKDNCKVWNIHFLYHSGLS